MNDGCVQQLPAATRRRVPSLITGGPVRYEGQIVWLAGTARALVTVTSYSFSR